MTDDIPLSELQVIWRYHGDRPDMPPLKVMTIGDADDSDYFASWGACNADFVETDDSGRLLMLFQHFHQLVTAHRVDPQAVHAAFLRIPEYRANIPFDLIPVEYRAEGE